MRRLVIGLIGLALGFLVPASSGAASAPASYPLGAAASCKPHYHEVIASHRVKGKPERYIECVYKAPATKPRKRVPTTTVPTTTVPANATRGALGSTLIAKDSDNNPLAVTVTQVVDPAESDNEFEQPDAGNRFVAVDLTLANRSGTATISDDANSDVTVIGTDDQDYTADFDDVSGCTNFSDGEFTVLPGNSLDGCVVFQLPLAVSAKAVQFSFDSGFTNTVQWSV